MEYTKPYRPKIMLIGCGPAGTTTIASRFFEEAKFNFNLQPRMLGPLFCIKKMLKGQSIELWIRELGDWKQRNKQFQIEWYLNDNIKLRYDGILFFYDITSRSSFEQLGKLIELIENFELQKPITLVGNKCDLQDRRNISKREGFDYAEKHNMDFFEVSAKQGTNIQLLLNYILQKLLQNKENQHNSNEIERIFQQKMSQLRMIQLQNDKNTFRYLEKSQQLKLSEMYEIIHDLITTELLKNNVRKMKNLTLQMLNFIEDQMKKMKKLHVISKLLTHPFINLENYSQNNTENISNLKRLQLDKSTSEILEKLKKSTKIDLMRKNMKESIEIIRRVQINTAKIQKIYISFEEIFEHYLAVYNNFWDQINNKQLNIGQNKYKNQKILIQSLLQNLKFLLSDLKLYDKRIEKLNIEVTEPKLMQDPTLVFFEMIDFFLEKMQEKQCNAKSKQNMKNNSDAENNNFFENLFDRIEKKIAEMYQLWIMLINLKTL